MNISDIRSIIKELVDESWLSDKLPQTRFDIQMGSKEKVTQSYWIKPDGIEFKTTYRGHPDKAKQILQAYPDKEKETLRKDPQLVLWGMGWVSLQINATNGLATIKHDATKKPTPEQIKTLRKISIQFNNDPEHSKKIEYIQDETSKRDLMLESTLPQNIKWIIGVIDSYGHVHHKIVKLSDPLDSHNKVWPFIHHYKWRWMPSKPNHLNTYGEDFGGERVDQVWNIIDKYRGLQESINLDERLTFADLYDDTDDERIAKSELPGMRVRPLQVTTNNDKDLWRFDYSYVSSEKSEWEQYKQKVGHKGHIYFFKENITNDDNLEDLECMVDCDCKDFKYRWAYALAQDDASIVGNKSLNKSTGAPPVKTNPLGHQQLCKHLSALRRYVITNIEKAMARTPYRKRPMNIFESMDQLANKGKFVTGYYDKKGK